MEPKDMDEVLKHATPTVARVQEHMRPETRALIAKANELLAIWQEQEKTVERAWDEQKKAHDNYVRLMEAADRSAKNGHVVSAEEILKAWNHWRTLSQRERELDKHYDAQRDWHQACKKARRAIQEDAGLLFSNEELQWQREEAKRDA